jgi:hypothetical protein
MVWVDARIERFDEKVHLGRLGVDHLTCWVPVETPIFEPSHLRTATHRHTLSQSAIA